MYVFQAKKDGQYLVSYSDFKDAATNAERRLHNARDGSLRSVRGKLVSEKMITIDSHPGLDLLIDSETSQGKVSFRTRIYAVKNRLFQTMVFGPADLVMSKEAGDFLESFRLNK